MTYRSLRPALSRTVFAAAMLACMPASSAYAQGVADEADALFSRGAEAYTNGELRSALLHFMQSNRLSPNAKSAGNVGHVYAALDQYPEAYRWYLEAKELGADPEYIDGLLKELEDRVVLLTVESDPPGADIYLNRRDLGVVALTPATLALDPGDYKVLVDKAAHTSFESEELALDARGTATTVTATLQVVTGRVTIIGDEDASVHLGDESGPEVCTVPCDADLPVGRQLLYFKKDGFRSQPSLVEVSTDRSVTVRTDLVLITGSVRVETVDPGALIEVDGQPAGYTPNIVTGVPAGRRVVRVSRPGSEAQVVEVVVPKDGQVDLGRVNLTRTTSVQSASRYAEDIFEAPASISVIGPEELEAFRYPTLVDSLRGVRGVHTQSWWGAGVTGVVGMRGLVPIPAVDPGQRTRFLRDGLVLETQSNSYGMQSQRAQELQSIEVQRGAGSVLYGTGAISGLVSMYTRDRVAESTAEVEGGAIGREAQGRAFLGLGDDELGGWVSVNGFNMRGIDLTLRNAPILNDLTLLPELDAQGDPRIEDINLQDLQPASGVNVETKVWAKDLELRYAHFSQNHRLNYGVAITPRDRWDENTNDTQRHLLDLVYKPELSDAVSLDSRVYGQAHRDRLYLTSAGYYVDRRNEDQWGGVEARMFIDPVRSWREDPAEKRRLRLSLGTEYHTYPKARNDQTFAFPAAGQQEDDAGEEDGMSVLAAYALLDARPVDFFALSVGGRVDSWNQKTPFTQFNPRLVGMLFPSDNDVIKVIAGRGFRVGDISERLTRTPTLIALPGPIDPETAWTGEVEYRHRFASDWTALGSVWQSSVQGLIEQLPNDDGLLESQNAFNGRIRGFDLELQRAFRGGWMLTTWYSRQEPESVLSSDNNAEFKQLPGSPKDQAAAKFVVPLPGGPRVATRIVYEGRRRLSGANGFTDDAVIADVVVSGRITGDHGSWFAGVYNLTGREWATPASTSTFLIVEAPELRTPLVRAGLELKGRLSPKAQATKDAAPLPEPPVLEVEPAAPEAPEVEEAETAEG